MAGKSSPVLVREYLEKVSGNLLGAQYRPAIAKMIRGHAGIYVLYKSDRLYYVGLAKDLMRRVEQHQKDHHSRKWDTFSVYLTSTDEHIKQLESFLLRIIQPKGNQQKGKLTGAQDQRPSLYKAMKEADSNQHAALLGGHLTKKLVRKKTTSTRGTTVLAGIIHRSIHLEREYKGIVYHATLRKDGHIHYGGEKYESPTAAAREVCKGPVNGWAFWHYRDAKRQWVPLSTLRK